MQWDVFGTGWLLRPMGYRFGVPVYKYTVVLLFHRGARWLAIGVNQAARSDVCVRNFPLLLVGSRPPENSRPGRAPRIGMRAPQTI